MKIRVRPQEAGGRQGGTNVTRLPGESYQSQASPNLAMPPGWAAGPVTGNVFKGFPISKEAQGD